jgi:PDZ domain-containing protein
VSESTTEGQESPPGEGSPFPAGAARPPGAAGADGRAAEAASAAHVQAGLERRSAVLLIAGFATVLLAAALALMPVPYAVFGPGPVLNTLGTIKGNRLISVTGTESYPTEGTLDMTTVRVYGGPGSRVTLVTALRAWLSDSRAVLPEEAVFPPGQTQQQSQEQDRLLMLSSQESATAAALGALNIPVPTTLNIAGISPDVPASKVLKPKDVLLKVGDSPIRYLTQLRSLLQRTEPGDDVRLTVRRGTADVEVVAGTTRGEDGQTLLGVFLDPKFTFPFSVKIDIPDVSGPSAGMVFALGIIDTLTPGDLTGGKRIAGTGTIDADGTVGPVGGIQQKLVGARRAGADFFLAPSVNCDEVKGHVPDGLQVVKVSTLTDARRAMEAIATGRPQGLPAC